MQGTRYDDFEGLDVLVDDLKNTEDTKADSIRHRVKDTLGAGVLVGLHVTVNLDKSVNISGSAADDAAYDANGERVTVTASIQNIPLASLTIGAVNYIGIAYKSLVDTARAHPITGAISQVRQHDNYFQTVTEIFDTSPSAVNDPTANLDINGNPIVLLATGTINGAGDVIVDETIRTMIPTLPSMQADITAVTVEADATKAEVEAARQDADTSPTLWGSLVLHLNHLWARFLGHEASTSNPHDTTMAQIVAAEAATPDSASTGVVTGDYLADQSLNPSKPPVRILNSGDLTVLVESSFAGETIMEIGIAGRRRITDGGMTVDLSVTGVGGRDGGAAPSGDQTWYLFGISLAGNSPSTWEVIATLNPSGPSPMPAGYSSTRQRYLTSFETSGAIIDTFDVFMDAAPAVAPNVVPSGTIVMWHGTESDFDVNGTGIGPLVGWAICNGNNATPNLQNFFVRAGNTASGTAPLATGGNQTHTHSTDGAHMFVAGGASRMTASVTTADHTHNLSTADHTPKFFALIFMMKL